MSPDVQYLRESDGYVVFKFDAFAVLVWKQTPSIEGVTRCSELFRLVRRNLSGAKFGYLSVVEEAAGLGMGSDVRKALGVMHKEFESSIAGAAIVFEGSGFRASIVRSVVSAIDFAFRMKFPSKVESDVTAAATWLGEHVGTVAATALVATVNRVRRRNQAAAE